MGGEELGLFGVGAEAGDDDQLQAGAAGGEGHAVEGGGDVGAHALAVAVDQGAAIATAARHRRHPFAATEGRSGFGHGRGFDRPFPTPNSLEIGNDQGLGADRRERGFVREAEPQPRRIDPVGAGRRRRRFAGRGEVERLRKVGGIRSTVGQGRRRQQLRQVVLHRSGGGDRGEVGGALGSPLSGYRAGDRDHRERRGDQRQGATEGQDQCLAALVSDRSKPHRPSVNLAGIHVVREKGNLSGGNRTRNPRPP
jgi:hypothetical protein